MDAQTASLFAASTDPLSGRVRYGTTKITVSDDVRPGDLLVYQTDERGNVVGAAKLTAAHNGTPTSKAAAKVVAPIQGEIAAQILAFAARCGEHGFTQAEASDAIKRERQYLTDPTRRLASAGLIVKTNLVRYRTVSRAPSAVYRITPAGVERAGGGK